MIRGIVASNVGKRPVVLNIYNNGAHWMRVIVLARDSWQFVLSRPLTVGKLTVTSSPRRRKSVDCKKRPGVLDITIHKWGR